jgi:O-antigen ligase
MSESADMQEARATMPAADPIHAPLAIGAITAVFIAFLSFSAGGFFPGTTAVAVLFVLAVLVVVVMTARRPGAALSARLIAATVALALFALWQLVSSSWSDAPGRALLAFDLSLLYVLVLATAGLTIDRPARLRALVYGVVVGMFAVCLTGLLSRTRPPVFPVEPGPSDDERLNFPLTYWNAMGLMGATAFVLCLGLTSSRREHPAVRIATAVAVPILAAEVLFTFSRGSIAVGIACTVLMIALAPRRELIGGLLATLPPAAVAVVAGYEADALARAHPTGADAVSQGRTVIIVVLLAAVAAGILRALLLSTLDKRLEMRAPLSRRTTLAIAGGIVVAVVVAGLAAGVPGRIDRGYDRFVHGSSIQGTDLRERLSDPGNNGRLKHWRIALDAYHSDELQGAGAGTYANWWNRLRPDEFDVLNAHSLYLEVLGETGIVGLLLLVLALLTAIAGALARVRGPDRALWAAMAAAMVGWAIEAGLDWTWQMPAASAWFFAFAGAALAGAIQPEPAVARGALSHAPRLIAGVALLVVAVTPVRIALSQQHLTTAVDALRRGDCQGTVASALSSARVLGARAEPYELLAYCDTRLGFGPLALTMVQRAIARDPENWEYRYDEAIVRGAQGMNPHPALAEARRLNPLENRVDDLADAMAGDDPRTWKRRALEARLLLPGE